MTLSSVRIKSIGSSIDLPTRPGLKTVMPTTSKICFLRHNNKFRRDSPESGLKSVDRKCTYVIKEEQANFESSVRKSKVKAFVRFTKHLLVYRWDRTRRI